MIVMNKHHASSLPEIARGLGVELRKAGYKLAPEIDTGLSPLTSSVHETMTAFIDQGFSMEEAFELTKANGLRGE